jgi:hypothetical protein
MTWPIFSAPEIGAKEEQLKVRGMHLNFGQSCESSIWKDLGKVTGPILPTITSYNATAL